jgi:hypothetical protein
MGERHAAILNSDSSSVKISVKCENDTRIQFIVLPSFGLKYRALNSRNSPGSNPDRSS